MAGHGTLPPATTDRLDLVRKFFMGTGASYDRIVNLCTLEIDRLWKRKILSKLPRHPGRILDLACGTGILTFKLASVYPSAQVLGVDVTPEYLHFARLKAEGQHTGNAEFVLSRAEDFILDQQFDCIVSSYLAKYADLDVLTANAVKMLRRGGVIVAHDFVYPQNSAVACLWGLYFKLLRTAGSRIYPEWKAAFEGLPDLVRTSVWVQGFKGQLHEKGFSDVTEERLTMGTAAIVTATKG
jgi:demethylmenaquinone methyltransferase / 2-methoxy-6-polyprenyl-1,4-benzoquinol methylase